MQSLSYSALDKSQLEQVKYLFADEVFGIDAAAFVYEVDKRGAVVGRTKDEGSRMKDEEKKYKGARTIKVIVAQEANAIDDFISQAHMSTDALTAIFTKKFADQLEEAHHE